MNFWRKTLMASLRLLMASVLVLTLTSCGDKAISQEPRSSLQEKAQLSNKISEVSPPATIQELRLALEAYQPQVTIETPKQDDILQDSTVTVRFQVKDLPIFKDPKLELGPHLHVIIDNEPYIAVYDLNQPLVLPDLSPGTHTLRVFASRPWHESFKNEGAYAQSTFHIFTKTDDNNPDPGKPVLTYSRPKGSYGAEPILLDFYLTNAPLHLVAQDNPNDDIADWRIRCTINGESFVLDRWQAVYLKGFTPGKNWVQLEFLDEQGNPVKNVFNSTVRLITYEPKGKDTLSKIVRGELSADQARSIVDPNYTAKTSTAEPTPSPSLTPIEETPQTQLQEEKQPVPETEATPSPTSTPSVEEKIPQTPPQVENQPVPDTGSQQTSQTKPEKSKSGGYFNRFKPKISKTPSPQTKDEPTPGLPPSLPEIIETPQPEVTPEAKSTLPEKIAPDPKNPELKRYFSPQQYPNATPSPTLPQTSPNVIESPSLLETLKQPSQETNDLDE